MKKIMTFLALMLGLLSTSVIVLAADNSQKVVEEYVDAINCKNWDKFIDLQVQEEREGYKNFFTDVDNIDNNRGILNIKSIKIIENKEINVKDVKDELRLEKEYTNLKVFVLGMDLEVTNDTRYYCNGINYNYIVLQEETGQWKILKTLGVYDPQKLLNLDNSFSESLNETVNIMDKRKEGVFVNSEGIEFDKLDGGQLSLINSNISNTIQPVSMETVPIELYSTTWYPSEWEPIMIGNNQGKIIAMPPWRTYILGCLAGEVRASQFNGYPRRAIALAIKTYTWNFLLKPRNISKGIDIWNTDQNYAPEYIDSNIIQDYDWIKNNWMVNSNGDVFEANYGRGNSDDSYHGTSPAKYYHSGKATQYGCEFLCRVQNYSFYDCMRYFYDYSPKSSGPIIFNFYKAW